MPDHWHLYVNDRLELAGTVEEIDGYLAKRGVLPGERVALRSGLDLSELPAGLRR